MSEPIVRVLYERGAFAATNGTPTVSAVLAIFGLGLPAFVLIKAFTPGYFAREDTRTPMYLRRHLGRGQRRDRADAVSVDRRRRHRHRLGGRRLGQRGCCCSAC